MKLKYEPVKREAAEGPKKTSGMFSGKVLAFAVALPLLSLSSSASYGGNASVSMDAVNKGDAAIVQKLKEVKQELKDEIEELQVALPAIVDVYEGGVAIAIGLGKNSKQPAEVFEHVALYNEKADKSFADYVTKKISEKPKNGEKSGADQLKEMGCVMGEKAVELKNTPKQGKKDSTKSASSSVAGSAEEGEKPQVQVTVLVCNDFNSIKNICAAASPTAPSSCIVGARSLLFSYELPAVKTDYTEDYLGNGVCQERDAVVRLLKGYISVEVANAQQQKVQDILLKFGKSVEAVSTSDKKVEVSLEGTDSVLNSATEELKKAGFTVDKGYIKVLAVEKVTVYSEKGTNDCATGSGKVAKTLVLSGAQ